MEEIKVLVVDDDLLSQKMLSRIIQSGGYVTVGANDGNLALDKIASEKIDFVVSDINMPNLNGIEFIKKLNELESKIPVIFLSGEENVEIKTEVLGLGASDYFIKPVNRDILVNRINEILVS